MQLLIDTGATTTFINKKIITQNIHDFTYISTLPYSFVLADGIAPFQVHGIVELQIQFANQITRINAYVADNLCTDIIIGMDYITQYNLKFDIRKQSISIEYNHKQYEIKFDHNIQPQFIPVILSNSIDVPFRSNRSVVVSTPISSICSSFVPHSSFSSHNSVIVPQKFLEFRNYVSQVTLSNLSFRTQFINRGTCLGYLCQYSPIPQKEKLSSHPNISCGAANLMSEQPDCLDISDDKNTQYDINQPDNFSTITSNEIHPSTENDFHKLTKHIDNTNQRDDLFSLLYSFRRIRYY